MKKLDASALQMQKLAGIITESEYNTEMAKMNKMEAEEGSGANTYKVVEIGSRGEEEGEEMVKSDLSIEEFCKELLKKEQAEILAMADSAEERAETLRHFKEFSGVGEYDDKWEVAVTEETGYDVYTEDQAASMNEMNKMNKMGRHSKMEEMNKMKSASKMKEAEEEGENVYRVEKIGSRGAVEDEDIIDSDLNIEQFCKQLLKDKMEEELSQITDPKQRAEMLADFKEWMNVGEYGDHWEVTYSEESGYKVYQM